LLLLSDFRSSGCAATPVPTALAFSFPASLPESTAQGFFARKGRPLFRRIFLLACTGGGVYGALQLMRMLAAHVGTQSEFTLTGEGALLAIPVGMVGALAGALLGGLIYPNKL
jgi:hypothetical protein